jgi:hypothetical protein
VSDSTSEVLGAIKRVVATAKSVPMSASVMVNKADLLALLDKADASLASDLAEAEQVMANARKTTYEAKADADTLINFARRKADSLVANHEIVRHAQEFSRATRRASEAEALDLRREADSYVDARIAELEAGLSRTLGQIKTMRARLADRSQLDEPDTTVLPRLAALPEE